MTNNPHGYSGKPLYQKLGLKPGMQCWPVFPPAHYSDLVKGADGVQFLKRAAAADIVHLFCAERRVLERNIDRALERLSPGGMLWVSWPKKSSSIYKGLSEGHLREIILPRGWVDVKVCAVDADWSALKFLRRKH